MSRESDVADHCCQFALSGETESYKVECHHSHNRTCEDCFTLKDTLGRLENSAKEVNYESEDQEDEIWFKLTQVNVKLIP